ncbi:methionine--tRNA ligase [Candidatus Uhrbacteria bacterium]|nr:methionine--tRNA ligase [Candidatus Uhrbacteria bacterium]
MKYYLTTPIYYINDKPHIGHAYTTIVSDILAHYHRLRGADVFFLTGVDENSLKNIEAAEKLGMGDRIQEYLDMQSALWKQTWDSLGITYTDFIRTTEERHKQGVEKFWKRVRENGDIYKGTYEGFYCVGCEAFIRETDLVDGKCQHHDKEPKKLIEENYFFALSKYRERLLAYIEQNPDFVQPQSRRNEIVNYIRDHLEDVSISRQSMKWGIPVPGDPEQVVYVWFDALINYLTGIGYGWDDELFARYWPADLHLVGKEIIKFHCALWPAMLMSAGISLPARVFAHGFFTIDGQKMSKSLGNAIDPVEIAKVHGMDAMRYFLLREVPFGGDGDFSYERFSKRYESDLSKGVGNFVSRVLAMAEKMVSGSISEKMEPDTIFSQGISDQVGDDSIHERVQEVWQEYEETFDRIRPDEALDAVWRLISFGDKYIEEKKPWAILKGNTEEYTKIIGILLELVRHVSLLLYPFMPETALKVWRSLGVEEPHKEQYLAKLKEWRAVPITKIERGEALFPLNPKP